MSAQNSDSNVVPIHADSPDEPERGEEEASTEVNTADVSDSPGNDNAEGGDVDENTTEDTFNPDQPEAPVEQSEPSAEDIKRGTRLLEALLFASAEPLSERMLSNRIPEGLNTKSLLKALQQDYAERGVNLVRVGSSWAFRTADDLSAILNVESEVSRKMSRATIETMAIVAYHQPVTRAEIEEIRGVSLSKGTLDALFEKEWIKPRGRRETPGRPMTWGTTDEFLDHFGLSRVTDLPGMDELKAAGLLESGPALNVYRSRGNLTDTTEESGEQGSNEDAVVVDPAALSPFTGRDEEDALPEVTDEVETEDPLDPEAL